jgi:serine protease Do
MTQPYLTQLLLLIALIVHSGAEQLHAQEHQQAPRPTHFPAGLTEDELRTAQLYAKALPTVVTIRTAKASPMSNKAPAAQPFTGLGTGVLITEKHHVLTAAHVVDDAGRIVVKTQDGAQHEATVVFSEPEADLALLRLDSNDAKLPYATMGDSSALVVGQSLFVIGNPRGLENTLTVGRLSAVREFSQLYDGTILARFLQTDAAINSGNSGGPVFDSAGNVVGITSRISTMGGGSEGLGFVVTINTAKQLLALEDRIWTGIQATFLSHEELSRLFHLDLPGGLLVQRVAPNSPAAAAGLEGGTITATIDGRQLMLGGDLIVRYGGQEACHAECLAHVHDQLVTKDQVLVKHLHRGVLSETTLDVSKTRRRVID